MKRHLLLRRTEQIQPDDDMNAALPLLLWLSCCRRSAAHERPPAASLMATPSRSQFYEYESVSISCQQFGPDTWKVWGYTETGLQVSQCGSGWGVQKSSVCNISTLKKPFSGVYWCESRYRDSSNTVNITVTGGPVILHSPVLPVTEGEDVTLTCGHKDGAAQKSASFSKDGSHIGTDPSGQMTLHKVSRSSEGGYQCEINGVSSPISWLLIKDVSKPVSLTMSPDSSQLFEYKSFSLSCSNNSTSQGWTIKRFPSNGNKISSCGGDWGKLTSSGCNFQTAKKPDSALYWCESPSKQRSNTVSITVHDSAVILQSPALPVKSGANVTLTCLTRNSNNLPADFYKNGSFIRTEPTGHMTLHPVSTSDEGSYYCTMEGQGRSPSSWLSVRASDEASPPAMMTYLHIILHIAAWTSYIYPTYSIISVFRHRHTGGIRISAPREEDDDEEGGADYDDAMAPVTTEHRF